MDTERERGAPLQNDVSILFFPQETFGDGLISFFFLFFFFVLFLDLTGLFGKGRGGGGRGPPARLERAHASGLPAQAIDDEKLRNDLPCKKLS